MTAYVLKRKNYWKYEYKEWTQPVLTGNGTLGGNSFAVSSSSNYSGWPAWEAFDGVLTGYNGWSASSNSYPQYLIFYNPVQLLVKKLTVINNYEGNVAFTAGNVYGSNDGSSWTLITSYTNDNTTSGASWDIVLNGNKTLYKYHKLEITKGNFISTNLIKCTEVLITAQTFEGIVKATKDDYDLRADKAYVLKRRQYWKKVVTEITKYWKETTTETITSELAFACYGLQHIKLYAKLPLGSDYNAWATSSTGIATSVDQLSRYPEVFGSISESGVTWGGA